MTTAILSGFADEAAPDLDGQIAAITALGWQHIDLRKIDHRLVHEHPPEVWPQWAERLAAAGLQVTSIGSGIANGQARLDDDPAKALAQAERCVALAQVLNTRLIRIMSWPPQSDVERHLDRPDADHLIARLRSVVEVLRAGGLEPLHENCHNWGGQSPRHSLRLIEEIPGLQLVFDTANPIGARDWSVVPPVAEIDIAAFYHALRDHIRHLHIKDRASIADGTTQACLPGDGRGAVREILADWLGRGAPGPVSIEPHLGAGRLDPAAPDNDDARTAWNFHAAGQRVAALVRELGKPSND